MTDDLILIILERFKDILSHEDSLTCRLIDKTSSNESPDSVPYDRVSPNGTSPLLRYSCLMASTGLARAAFMTLEPMVRAVTMVIMTKGAKNSAVFRGIR